MRLVRIRALGTSASFLFHFMGRKSGLALVVAVGFHWFSLVYCTVVSYCTE